jgi:cytochrome c biogenesis protein CcmG, thiol:disulfide interchange protein DsbE
MEIEMDRGTSASAAATRGGRGRVIAWTLALAVVAALLVVGLAGRGAGAGPPAPALPGDRLAGAPVTLASLLGAPGSSAAGIGANKRTAVAIHGKHAALVLFWASWCTPCQHEAPAVESFARSAAGRGRIVGIDYGESELAGARAFVHRYGWTFPTLADPDGETGEAYGVTGLPTTFAVDARGRISARLSGPQTEQSLAHALAAAG